MYYVSVVWCKKDTNVKNDVFFSINNDYYIYTDFIQIKMINLYAAGHSSTDIQVYIAHLPKLLKITETIKL